MRGRAMSGWLWIDAQGVRNRRRLQRWVRRELLRPLPAAQGLRLAAPLADREAAQPLGGLLADL